MTVALVVIIAILGSVAGENSYFTNKDAILDTIHENDDAELDIWHISAHCYVREWYNYWKHVACQSCVLSEGGTHFKLEGMTVKKKACNANQCGPICSADGCLKGGSQHTVRVRCYTERYKNNGEVSHSFTVSVQIDPSQTFSYSRTKARPEITNLDDTVYFPEDTGLGTILFVPTVNDPDTGESHTFSARVKPEEGASNFQLNALTGELVLNQSLDYEGVNLYMFTYTVRDVYLPTEFEKTLKIQVANVNEGNTITASETTLSFLENMRANTELPDAGLSCDEVDGDTTSFSIAGGVYSNYFSIDSTTGRLTLLQEWDLESGLPPSTSLTISCTDPGGLSSTVDIFINIEGVNDNRPNIITSDEPMISIDSSTCLCKDLMTFDASDNDVEDDGEFEYAMLGDGIGARLFHMVPVAGTTRAKLRLKAIPDFSNDKLFQVSVMVSDGETRPLFARLTIDVNYTAGKPDASYKQTPKCLTCTGLGKSVVGALIIEGIVCLAFVLHVCFSCFG